MVPMQHPLAIHLRATGETQTAFAERVGVHQATISKICAGAGVSLRLALRIERATGGAVTAASLLPDEERGAA